MTKDRLGCVEADGKSCHGPCVAGAVTALRRSLPLALGGREARLKATQYVAYACYFYLGLFLSLGAAIVLLPVEDATKQVLGMVVLVPAFVLAILAAVVAGLLSLWNWSDRSLRVLGGLTLLCAAMIVLEESIVAPWFQILMGIFISVSAVVVLVLPIVRIARS